MTARYLFVVLVLLSVGVITFGWIYTQMEEQDTSYQCRPGEAYTTYECR